MRGIARNMILLSLVFFMTVLAVKPVASHENYSLKSRATATISEANPLMREMMALDNAFRDIVSAVVLGDSDAVQRAIASMHGTREKTREGIHAGTVALPKNVVHVKDFIEMDRAFHDKLEALDRAAHHNNLREMQRITHQLMNACVQCHQMFKK